MLSTKDHYFAVVGKMWGSVVAAQLFSKLLSRNLKSVNLQFIMLVHRAGGTNESSTNWRGEAAY